MQRPDIIRPRRALDARADLGAALRRTYPTRREAMSREVALKRDRRFRAMLARLM
jgi:hypothetical protein